MNETQNKPLKSNRVGRFNISIWKKKRIVPAKNDFDVEREVETVRACIQYSRYNKANGTWENQSIWCEPEHLRNLVKALDQLNESPENVGED